MIKIVFVCTGNTCRSPMAEAVLKSFVKKEGVKGVAVTSAGLNAAIGSPMSVNSVKTLKKAGIKAGSFKSKRLTERTFKTAAAVICMTEEQADYLRRAVKGKDEFKIYPMSFFSGESVPDPYGKDEIVYEKTLETIFKGCETLFAEIKTKLKENEV